ncbi:hypothetical protein WJX81_007397 [Elliptochloris bilobata]|uniref:J domain-containing protein n=1 Tax=Elliptochloris bilobata TaxID=381761 RepID=A0AAW1SII1_9CHLO
MNEVSGRTLAAMLACDERRARDLLAEIEEQRVALLECTFLEKETMHDSARFLRILQGLLQHEVLREAQLLHGSYQQALDRLLNQAAGCDWKLAEEGQPANASDEPQFSTWDDVMGRRRNPAGNSGSSASSSAAARGGPGRPVDMTYYRVLGVAADVEARDVRAAYRAAALREHPDVSAAPDAEQRFKELSVAYDVLSDATARALYDEVGAERMHTRAGAGAGAGNARAAWDEFKPFQREGKRSKARAAAAAAAAAGGDGKGGAAAGGGAREPAFGDVVEYPLRAVEVADLCDGRTAGVGLLVGRNCDRGDAAKLPPEQLDLCEIEPLRLEESGSNRWIKDDLGIPSIARLGELVVLPVAAFDRRFDVWTINAELSDGCGSPELPEEVML